MIATGATPKLGHLDLLRAKQAKHRWLWFIGNSAVRAVLADQSKTKHSGNARGEKKRLDLHIDQAGKNAGSASAVNRADHQVAGEAGLNGNRGRFRISNLTDHDHLRVLPHQRTQCDRVRELFRAVDLRLADHREMKLDRVFYRADADGRPMLLHKLVKRRINGRSLP